LAVNPGRGGGEGGGEKQKGELTRVGLIDRRGLTEREGGEKQKGVIFK